MQDVQNKNVLHESQSEGYIRLKLCFEKWGEKIKNNQIAENWQKKNK